MMAFDAQAEKVHALDPESGARLCNPGTRLEKPRRGNIWDVTCTECRRVAQQYAAQNPAWGGPICIDGATAIVPSDLEG